MTTSPRPFNRLPDCPAVEIATAIDTAARGIVPDLNPAAMLATLGLDGDTPDGRTLMERVTTGVERGLYSRAIVEHLARGAVQLTQRTNEHTANPAEEFMARLLGNIVTRQVIREGDICPGAEMLALVSTRKDLISDDVRARLAAGLPPGFNFPPGI